MHGLRHRRRLVAALIALTLAPTTRSAPGEAAVAAPSTGAQAEATHAAPDGKEADGLTLLLGAVAALVFVSRRSSEP